jgi:mannosyl-3-phosphoglycerate phosphatase
LPPAEEDAHQASGGAGVRRIALGYSYDVVVATLRDAAARYAVPIRGFADMSVAEVAHECGLPALDAQLAKLREFDEPFRILSQNPDACRRLLRALRRAGLGVLQGGRFYHAVGGTDKGAAVEALRRLVARRRPALLVGLGDAPNDAAMLRAVDVPVIIRSGDEALTAWLRDRIPAAVVTDEPGPTGWADAVSHLVDRWEAGGWQAIAGGSRR